MPGVSRALLRADGSASKVEQVPAPAACGILLARSAIQMDPSSTGGAQVELQETVGAVNAFSRGDEQVDIDLIGGANTLLSAVGSRQLLFAEPLKPSFGHACLPKDKAVELFDFDSVEGEDERASLTEFIKVTASGLGIRPAFLARLVRAHTSEVSLCMRGMASLGFCRKLAGAMQSAEGMALAMRCFRGTQAATVAKQAATVLCGLLACPGAST